MAHGVKPTESFRVGQTLHGYADGHRQLATSVDLKSRDLKTMLVMSDISGPGASIEEDGYLTGYPLNESKMYALGRTWAAQEMPRPGCVWTHTLLLDFADLARLTDPTSVLSLFRRPMLDRITGYEKSLSVGAGRNAIGLGGAELEFARPVVAGLYGRPNDKMIIERPIGLNAEAVVLALWAQQWPRLRRAFRFCTFSAADRSMETSPFDLQLLPFPDRSIRSRFSGVSEIRGSPISSEAWLDEALSDLFKPDVAELRTFLWRVGGDVDTGRGAFRSLCLLHVLVQELKTSPQAINQAIELLENTLGSVKARAARSIVASQALTRLKELNASAFNFLIRNLDLLESDQLSKQAGAIGSEIWRRDVDRFAEMQTGDEIERLVSSRGLAALNMDEIISGLKQRPDLSALVLASNPEVVTRPEFWSRENGAVDAALAELAGSKELEAALPAMITALRDDLATRAVEKLGSYKVLQAVATLFDDSLINKRSSGIWLAAVASDPNAVAEFLANKEPRSYSILSAIARTMQPDTVPNDYGIDPWLIAWQSVAALRTADPEEFLRAFLLARALGRRSQNPGELATATFEPIYLSARAADLSDEAWRTLDQKLPWSFSWFTWDHCYRLRVAVRELFVERQLSPEFFANIASDDRVFDEVAEAVALNDRGLRYLERVKQWMIDDDPFKHAVRIKVIGELLLGRFRSRSL